MIAEVLGVLLVLLVANILCFAYIYFKDYDEHNNKQIVKAMFWAEDDLNATELGDMFKTFLDNNNVAFEVCNPGKDKRVGVQELVEENTLKKV
jgi:hypothetical protein